MSKNTNSPNIVIAPVHIGIPENPGDPAGADAIAATFGVKRETVIGWRCEGAPIALVGNRLQAEYNVLMQWLVDRQNLKKL